MFKFLRKDSVIEMIVEKITKNLNQNLNSFESKQDEKFELVLEHLEKLRFELSNLDQRISSKEIKDRQDYGQMQYKLNSLQSELIKKPKSKREH